MLQKSKHFLPLIAMLLITVLLLSIPMEVKAVAVTESIWDGLFTVSYAETSATKDYGAPSHAVSGDTLTITADNTQDCGGKDYQVTVTMVAQKTAMVTGTWSSAYMTDYGLEYTSGSRFLIVKGQKLTFSITAAAEATVNATFAFTNLEPLADSDLARYQVGSNYYDYLDQALAAAASGTNKTVITVRAGEIRHSTGENSFTIPSGVKLLVSYGGDLDGNFGTANDIHSVGNPVPSVQGNLTLPAGSTITVANGGMLNVNTRHTGIDTSNYGQPSGDYGLLQLAGSGNQLILQSGSTLYCYGYITGTGTVKAEGGSKIYELLQVGDWRGGNRALSWKGKSTDAMLFSQIYAQNIEAKLEIHAGSSVIVSNKINASSDIATGEVPMIGSSNGLFTVSSGYLERDYDPYTDRMTYSLYGVGTIGAIKLDALGAYAVDSTNYIMPLNSNMTVRVMDTGTETGSQMTMTNSYKLLPEAEIYVDDHSELIANGRAVIYGLSEWIQNTGTEAPVRGGNYGIPLKYIATTKTKSVRYNGLNSSGAACFVPSGSAHVIIDGTLTINSSGSIYTTGSADVDTDKAIQGKGRIVNNGTSNLTTIQELTETSGLTPSVGTVSVPVQSALLLLAGQSEHIVDLKNIGTATYEAEGESIDHFWYQNTVSITGAVDQLEDWRSGKYTLNSDGETATGYSVTGGYFRFALPYEYAPSVGDTVLTGTPIEGQMLLGYEVQINDNNTVITIAENNQEPNVTVHTIAKGSGEIVDTQQVYMPVGIVPGGFFSDPKCTTAAPAITDGAVLYRKVGAMIAWNGDLNDVTYYMSLEEALLVVTGDTDVLYLHDNMALTEPMLIQPDTVRNLNVNGNAITFVGSAFDVFGKLDLDLNGGTITNSAAGVTSAICVYFGGTADVDTTGGSIVVDDGTTNQTSLATNAIYNGGTLYLRGNGLISYNGVTESEKVSSLVPAVRNMKNGNIALIENVTIDGLQAAIYNEGTITSISGNATIISGEAGTTHGIAAIVQAGTGRIESIGGSGVVTIQTRRGTIATGTTQDDGTIKYTYSNQSYPIYCGSGTSIGVLGAGSGTVNIVGASTTGIYLNKATIGVLGSNGGSSTVNITSTDASDIEGANTTSYGVYAYNGSTIGVLGSSGIVDGDVATINITNPDYGVYLYTSGTTIDTVGVKGNDKGVKATANINITAAYGIDVYSAGAVINTVGSKGNTNGASSTVNLNVTGTYALYQYSTNTIDTIGGDHVTVNISSSGTYGLYMRSAGTINLIGGNDSTVNISCVGPVNAEGAAPKRYAVYMASKSQIGVLGNSGTVNGATATVTLTANSIDASNAAISNKSDSAVFMTGAGTTIGTVGVKGNDKGIKATANINLEAYYGMYLNTSTTIGTIGSTGNVNDAQSTVNVNATGPYGVYLVKTNTVDTVGGDYVTLNVTGGTSAALYAKASGTINMIGGNHATVNINGTKSAVYVLAASTIDEIGGTDSFLNISGSTNAVYLSASTLNKLGGTNCETKLGMLKEVADTSNGSTSDFGNYALQAVSNSVIGTVGGTGSKLWLRSDYNGILLNNSTLETLGTGSDYLVITQIYAGTSYSALELVGTAKITTVGSTGSDILFSGYNHAVLLATGTEITTFAGAGSQVEIKAAVYSKADVRSMNIQEGAKVVTIAETGSTLDFTRVDNKQTVAMTQLSVSGTLGTLGAGGTINFSSGSSSATVTAIAINATGIVGDIGTNGSTIIVDNPNTSKGKGIVIAEGGSVGVIPADETNAATSGTIGAEGSKVQIVVGENAIENLGTIENLGAGLIAGSLTEAGYPVSNSGTITNVTGGHYYHSAGQEHVFSDGLTQNYPEGYTLSSDTVPVSVTINGTTTEYGCFYLSDHVHEWEVSYEWTQKEDGWYCTATRACTGDASHNLTEEVKSVGSVRTEATCEAEGWTTYTAEFEAEWAESQTQDQQDIPIADHTEVIDAAVAATCTETGLTEGKHCSVCNKVIVAQEVVAALGHTEVVDAAVAATCTETGLTEGKHCSVCHEVIVAQEVVAALGHTEVVDAAVAATCTETGLTEGKHCSVCNEVIVAQEVVAALGHTPGAAADCENAQTCTVCGEVLQAALGHTPGAEADCENAQTCTVCGEVLKAALGHTEGAAVMENEVAATCTAEGSYENVVYCSVCNTELSRDTVTVDKVAHDYDAVVTAPTCTEEGYTTYTCSACGDSYVADETEKVAHTHAAAVAENTVESTCTVAGSYESVVYCSVCNTELSRETKALALAAHTEGAVVVENNVAPTCTATGSYDNVVRCSVCNTELSRDTVTVDKVAHDYDAVVTAPTCTEEGYTTYTCSACGDSYVADETEKVAHTPAAAVAENTVESTCTVAGSYDEVVYCSACNTELSRETKALALAAHTEGAVVVENNVAPTCTATGSYDNVVRCSVCNTELSRDTVTVDKVAHDYDAVVTAPTCTEEGYTTYTCSACGDSYVADETEKVAHTPAAAVAENTVESTCTVAGSYDEVVYCSACNTELSRETKALALAEHTEGAVVVENNVAPTCTATGSYDNVVRCSVCNTELSRDTVTVDKVAHDYDAVVTAPTCTKEGYTTYTCSACGDSYVADEVAAVGHSYTSKVTKEATCTEKGVKTFTCACGDTYTEEIAAKGHSEVIDAAVEPDCVNTGLTEGKHCGRCGAVLVAQQQIPANGHTEVVDAAVEADCVNTGLTEGKHCDVCGEILVAQETVDALGHDYESQVIEPDFGVEGYTQYTCSRCGDTYKEDIKPALIAEAANSTTGKKYESLADAVNDAQNGETVVLLKDASGTGMIIDKDITIDFGGYTYTFTEGVGSTGTPSNGLQLLKDNDITLRNGTLKVAEDEEIAETFYILVQNYANLTVEDMTLDGTNLDKWSKVENYYDSYTLSNNSGEVNILGETYIIANDEGEKAFAMDVCKFQNYEAPVVNIDITGKITGKIEVSSEASENLNISHGLFTVPVEESWCAEGFIPEMKAEGLYGVKNGRYVAQVDETKYETLNDAVAAAQAEGSTVKLLADLEVETVMTLDNVTLDLNGHSLKATVIGRMMVNKGLLITAEDYKMIGVGADYYKSEDAVLTMDAAGSIAVESGSIELAQSWWTGAGQTLTIGEGATFTIPAGMKLNVNGSTVVVNGTAKVDGEVHLYSADATVKAAAGLNVTHNPSAGDKVLYVDGKYTVHTHIPGADATCTADQVCLNENCGDVLAEKLGHDEVTDAAVAPTCTATGLTEGKHCGRCGEILIAQETVDALGHDEVIDAALAPTCTATGLTEGKHCGRCGATLVAQTVVDALGHDYDAVVTAPTCTEQGYTTYTCQNTGCGDSYKSDYVDALGHTEVTVPGYAATCTKDGLTDGVKCEVCGEVLTAQEVITAPGHTEEILTAVPATCTETGLTEGKKCTACDEILIAQEVTKALGHDWTNNDGVCKNDPSHTCTHTYENGVCTNCGFNCMHENDTVVTAPTCTQDGYTTDTCKLCGLVTKHSSVPALGHTEAEAVVENNVAPDCVNDGSFDTVVYCATCGTELSRITTVVPATGHDYRSEVTAPTCTEEGFTTYTCAVCGDTYKADYVDALGHTEAEAVVENEKAATCTATGSYDTVVYCSVCNAVLSRETTVTDKLAHTEVELPAVAPECEKTGLTAGVKCSVCGEILVAQEEVEALKHSEEEIPALPATCTAKGLTAGVKCAVCDKILVAQEEVAALGHTEVEIPAAAPDCETEGKEAGVKCEVCGEILAEGNVIPALGHTPEALEGKEATCTEPGLTAGSKCTVCNKILVEQETIDAKGHTEETVPGKEATCTEAGLTDGKKCAVCGKTLVEQETIPALGHSYEETVTKEATCGAEGEKTLTCACGDTYTEAIPATGEHTEEAIAEVPATCVTPGSTAGTKCSTCDTILVEPTEIPATGEHNYVDGVCTGCGKTNAPEYRVVLSGMKLNYQSEILAQILVILPDELLADENAKLVLTKDGTWGPVEKIYSASELRSMTRESTGEHVVEIGLASPEFGRKIKIEVFDGQGNALTLYSKKGTALGTAREVTAIDYAKVILTASQYSQEEKNLVAALLTYGGYAQKVFKVDVDAPVYNHLTDLGIAVPDISTVTADLVAHKAVQNDVKNGISTTGFEAVLDSSTSFRIFFSLAQGEDPSNYDFVLTYIYAGKEQTMPITATFNESNRTFCVVIEDIPAAYWDYMYKVSVTKKTTNETYEVSASILAWIRQVIRNPESPEHRDLAKAMYLYNQAANIFFKK